MATVKAATTGVQARKKMSLEERSRVRSGKLGDFEKIIIFVERPRKAGDHWRLVDRSDLEILPPGIVPNERMTRAAREKCFLLKFYGDKQSIPAFIFCRVERGEFGV